MRSLYITGLAAMALMAADKGSGSGGKSATAPADLTGAIKTAALALDNTADADWQEDGRPSLKRIRALAKDNTITQDQLDEALPDFKRQTAPAKVDPKTVQNVRQVTAAELNRPDLGTRKILEGVRVVAHERGYYGGALREPGESFVFTGAKGSWMHEETKEEKAERERIEKLAQNKGPNDGSMNWAHEVAKVPLA